MIDITLNWTRSQAGGQEECRVLGWHFQTSLDLLDKKWHVYMYITDSDTGGWTCVTEAFDTEGEAKDAAALWVRQRVSEAIAPPPAGGGIPYAHLFAQSHWHDEAYLVGNRAALLAISQAIESALADDVGAAELFVGDGEGYYLFCVQHERLADVAWPYTDGAAREMADADGRAWPFDLHREKQAAAAGKIQQAQARE